MYSNFVNLSTAPGMVRIAFFETSSLSKLRSWQMLAGSSINLFWRGQKLSKLFHFPIPDGSSSSRLFSISMTVKPTSLLMLLGSVVILLLFNLRLVNVSRPPTANCVVARSVFCPISTGIVVSELKETSNSVNFVKFPIARGSLLMLLFDRFKQTKYLQLMK